RLLATDQGSRGPARTGGIQQSRPCEPSRRSSRLLLGDNSFWRFLDDEPWNRSRRNPVGSPSHCCERLRGRGASVPPAESERTVSPAGTTGTGRQRFIL